MVEYLWHRIIQTYRHSIGRYIVFAQIFKNPYLCNQNDVCDQLIDSCRWTLALKSYYMAMQILPFVCKYSGLFCCSVLKKELAPDTCEWRSNGLGPMNRNTNTRHCRGCGFIPDWLYTNERTCLVENDRNVPSATCLSVTKYLITL